MVPAPVGFQCPGCVAAAAQGARAPVTSFGGRTGRSEAPVTKALVVANLAVYGLGVLAGLAGASIVPAYGMVGAAVATGEWWRLLTAPFLHAGLWHVGLNMFALWVLGGVVEPLLGRGRFLALYVLSALGGTVASYLFNSPLIVSVGASGAVFGLLGATLVLLRRLDRDVSGVVVILLLNVVLGFVLPGIDWRAHLGGLLVGAVVAAGFAYPPRGSRTLVGALTCAAVALAMAWLVSGRTDQIIQAVLG